MGWAHMLPELVDVALELEKQGNSIIYWERDDYYFPIEKSKFPNTIFHNYNSAVRCLSAEGLDSTDFFPPGADFLSKLYEVESVVLFMMEKEHKNKTIQERRQLYYDFIKYWHGVVKKFKPDVIIHEDLPHHLHHIILYYVASALGVKNIVLNSTPLSSLIISYNYKFENEHLKREIRDNLNGEFSVEDLPPFLRSSFQEHLSTFLNPILMNEVYYANRRKEELGSDSILLFKLHLIVRSILDLSIFSKLFNHLLRKIGNNFKKEYLTIQINPIFTRKYIYVPLAFQPEAGTITLGGVYANQILMIETLAAALPKDWIIYVKEHPIMFASNRDKFDSYRYKGYYKKISEIKNVFCIPAEIDSYELIKNCQVVASVGGTAGWEAVLRGKSAMIFGYCWYRYCPGVFKVSSVESCRIVLDKISNGFSVSRQSILNFLYAFKKFAVNGCIYTYYKEKMKISDVENAKNITQALISELQKLNN